MCDASYLVVKASLLDHVDEDIVSLAGDLNSLLGNVAKNPDGNPGSAFDLVSRRFKAGKENKKLEDDQHTRGMGACLPATRGCRVADQCPVKLSKSEVEIHPPD